MRTWRLLLLTLFSLPALTAVAQEAGDKVVSIADAAEHAVQQSKLTLAGGAPFHLKAHITNAGTPLSRSTAADVEEYLGLAGKMAAHCSIRRFFSDVNRQWRQGF